MGLSPSDLLEKCQFCRRFIRNISLKGRLTALSLIVSIPLLIAITYLVTHIAATQMQQDADEKLHMLNQKLSETAQIWLDFHIRALSEITTHPDIVSMDASRQKPHLERVARNNEHIYLASTTDLQGMNVARSDNAAPIDYQDRQWFQEAKAGKIAWQGLIGRSRNQPALVLSMPIRDEGGKIIGVGMFAGYLTKLSQDVHSMQVGSSGYAYVIDENNKVIAHPIASQTSELRDFSHAPPVAALRQGHRGPLEFADSQGVVWGAYVTALDNGWGIIVQQERSEILAPLKTFRTVSKVILACGAMILLLLSIYLIRNALKPVSHLTDTATAIASGDLTRRATVESEDEIGLLSKAFNHMAGKLQGIIQHQQEQKENLESINALLESEVDRRKLMEEQLRELAEIDPLTRIGNRRKLDLFLDSETLRANRFMHPLSLIMFDLDHFKQVNDQYGHIVGDEVLKRTAALVGRMVRDVDLFARYGGEEFVIVCTETDLSGAGILAEKIRQAMEQCAFDPPGRVTVSLGVVQYRPGETSSSLLQRVDACLYAAKNKGRNRVEVGA